MKRQIIIDDYDFVNGYLSVFFSIDNNDSIIEDNIDEDIFEEYITKSGDLEYFEDCWDGHTESHFTKEYVMDYSDWVNEHCDKSYILDFLYYYYKSNKIPEPIEE